ncbi:MAG TPA: hypothetical protein VHG92_13145 [Afifellaceae bacterium]|nr:hypothetical protein [Afifellaceae bacterium]
MNRLLDSAFRRVVRHGPLEVAWASGAAGRYGSPHRRNMPGKARRNAAHFRLGEHR